MVFMVQFEGDMMSYLTLIMASNNKFELRVGMIKKNSIQRKVVYIYIFAYKTTLIKKRLIQPLMRDVTPFELELFKVLTGRG